MIPNPPLRHRPHRHTPPLPGGDYGVRLKNGTERSLSRGRRDELEEKLGITK